MEWYEGEDQAVFGETASRYASWALDNINVEDLSQRVNVDEFDWEMVRQGGQAGFIVAPLPEEIGGPGLDSLSRMVVIERMAMGLAGPATLFSVHWAGISALSMFSDREQVRSWLVELSEKFESDRPLLCGVAIPAVVVEDGHSHLPELLEHGSGLKLSGDFICPVHPALCDRLVIPMARTGGDAALVWAGGAELAEHCKEAHPGSGILEIPLVRLALDGLEVPVESRLASAAQAEQAASGVKRELYLGFASAMIGNAASAASYSWDYSHERVQTGRLIFEHQEVRKILENMKTLVEAARGMVYTSAAQISGPEALDRARRAFMFSGSTCETVCLDAIQTLGGYGYMKDYGLERRLRDLKSIQCLLGGHFQEWIGENW